MQHALAIMDRPAAAADPTRFVFGGVAFDVHAGPGVRWALTDEHRLFTSDYAQEPVFARVHLAVVAAPELAFEQHREVVGAWDGDVALVRTSRARAEIRDLGSSFVATARVAPDGHGCASLCTAMLAQIAERHAAVILHATGVDLGGEGVLFIGPSGAGKSTAADHCRSGRWFARDRAIVFETAGRWYASPLPGGGECELARSEARVLPLRGVYRVRKSTGEASVRAAGFGPQLAYLRESMLAPAASAGAERMRLNALLKLASSVRVAEVHTVLGRSLERALGLAPRSLA